MKRAMRTVLCVAVVLAAQIALAGRAEAKQVRYVGPHPVKGGGFCYLEVPHVHVYAPAHADVLYRKHDDAYYFVGDPVPYGYEGPKHAYYGPHPVPVDASIGESDVDGDEIEYCYLDGPHFHYYVPPPGIRFAVKGGVYWYVGDLPDAYRRHRPRLARVNAVYRPLEYERPVVVVAPPPEYHGPVVEVEPAHVELVAPAAEVVAPVAEVHAGVGVAVEVPAPSLEVRVGLPGVIVEPGVVVEEHHHHGVVVVPSKVKHRKYKHGDRGRHRGHWK